MTTVEIILIGVALSMDAAALSMTNGMVYRNMSRGVALSMPALFGLAQAVMPCIGFFAGSFVASAISRFSPFLVFAALGIIGAKMLKDSFSSHKVSKKNAPALSAHLLLVQAVATSIDALAVGFGFGAASVNIFFAAGVIGVTTFVCSLFSIWLGKKFGDLLGKRAELLGGTILIILAIKSLL